MKMSDMEPLVRILNVTTNEVQYEGGETYAQKRIAMALMSLLLVGGIYNVGARNAGISRVCQHRGRSD